MHEGLVCFFHLHEIVYVLPNLFNDFWEYSSLNIVLLCDITLLVLVDLHDFMPFSVSLT